MCKPFFYLSSDPFQLPQSKKGLEALEAFFLVYKDALIALQTNGNK
jgi:hypothetical protein